MLPPVEDRCVAGNETYAIGDIVRIDSDPCKVNMGWYIDRLIYR